MMKRLSFCIEWISYLKSSTIFDIVMRILQKNSNLLKI